MNFVVSKVIIACPYNSFVWELLVTGRLQAYNRYKRHEISSSRGRAQPSWLSNSRISIKISCADVCNIYRAVKVTVDDKLAPANPCYFCKDCYFLLHYGNDESLLYSDFSVYDYQHD
jgi:hypothetical protein